MPGGLGVGVIQEVKRQITRCRMGGCYLEVKTHFSTHSISQFTMKEHTHFRMGGYSLEI